MRPCAALNSPPRQTHEITWLFNACRNIQGRSAGSPAWLFKTYLLQGAAKRIQGSSSRNFDSAPGGIGYFYCMPHFAVLPARTDTPAASKNPHAICTGADNILSQKHFEQSFNSQLQEFLHTVHTPGHSKHIWSWEAASSILNPLAAKACVLSAFLGWLLRSPSPAVPSCHHQHETEAANSAVHLFPSVLLLG